MLGIGLAMALKPSAKAFGLGIEQSDDPGFDNAGMWSPGTGWAVTGSKAVGTTASTSITRADAGFTAGAYRVTFTVSSYSAGSVRASLGSSPVLGAVVNANGSYSQDIIATSGGQYGFTGTGFTGQIDNFSIKAIS